MQQMILPPCPSLLVYNFHSFTPSFEKKKKTPHVLFPLPSTPQPSLSVCLSFNDLPHACSSFPSLLLYGPSVYPFLPPLSPLTSFPAALLFPSLFPRPTVSISFSSVLVCATLLFSQPLLSLAQFSTFLWLYSILPSLILPTSTPNLPIPLPFLPSLFQAL